MAAITPKRRSRRVRRVRRGARGTRSVIRRLDRSLSGRLTKHHRRVLRGRGWYGPIPTSWSDVKQIPGNIVKGVKKHWLPLAATAGLAAAAYYGQLSPQVVGAASALMNGANNLPFVRHIPGARRVMRYAELIQHAATLGTAARNRPRAQMMAQLRRNPDLMHGAQVAQRRPPGGEPRPRPFFPPPGGAP